ncbi:Importin-5 [Nymphaea thermarum]|nr:Importin-5 [Nymphaea thermarum]
MNPSEMQAAQLAAILGPDPAPFETLIAHLMATSNDQRSQAEALFNLCNSNHPDALALKLVVLLQSSPQPELRAMAAILLRKQITRDDSFIWPSLFRPDSGQHQREDTKTILKKLCDTIAELASSIVPEGQWPELLPFMFQCVTSDSPRLRESALLMFAQLSQYIGDILLPHLSTLHSVFHQCLAPSAPSEVRIAALSATINFIQTIESPSDRDCFQDLLPPMMQTLTEALNRGEEATAQEALEMFVELAGTEPKFLRRQLVDIVGSMLQIAEADQLEDGTRHLAIEFIITLAEARERAPGMMRKLPQFIGRLFAILMKMLLDIEDDPAWHTAEMLVNRATTAWDRLAISLGGNTIVPVASEILSGFLAAPEWQKHHSALITLAQIAEGCSKDRHPRVRWAAINAIGQLSTDLGPDLQTQYHQRVLPALASAMDDFQNPRVQKLDEAAVDKSGSQQGEEDNTDFLVLLDLGEQGFTSIEDQVQQSLLPTVAKQESDFSFIRWDLAIIRKMAEIRGMLSFILQNPQILHGHPLALGSSSSTYEQATQLLSFGQESKIENL